MKKILSLTLFALCCLYEGKAASGQEQPSGPVPQGIIATLQDGVWRFDRPPSSGPNFFEQLLRQFGWKPAKARPFGRSVALLIGVASYDTLRPQLSYVENDLTELRNFLLTDGGFDTVIELRNGVVKRSLVEKYMVDRFSKESDDLGRDDRLLFYYSGHGADQAHRFGYLQFSRAKEGNFAGEDVLALHEFQEWAKLNIAKHLLIILDACSSGLAISAKGGLTQEALLNSLSGQGSGYLLTAGTGDQKAWQIEIYKRKGYSILTRALMHALQDSSTDSNNSGFFTINEAFARAEKEIAQFQIEQDRKMTPQLVPLARQDGLAKGTFVFVNTQAKNLKIHREYANVLTTAKGDLVNDIRTTKAADDNSSALAEIEESKAASLIEDDPAALEEGTILLADAMWHKPSFLTERSLRRNLELMRKPVRVLEQRTARVTAVSNDGRLLVTGAEDGTVSLYDAESLQILKTWRSQSASTVVAVVFSKDGRYMACASSDGIARIFEVSSLTQVKSLEHKSIRSLAFSPDGQRVAIVGEDVVVIDIAENRHTIQLPHDLRITAVKFSNNRTLIAGGIDGKVRIVDLLNPSKPKEINVGDSVRCLSVSPNGIWVAVGNGNRLTMWRENQDTPRVAFSTNSTISAIAFDRDANWLAVGGNDGAAHVYDVTDMREAVHFKAKGRINDISFSDDARWVAFASTDKTASILDRGTGNEIARIAHADLVNTLAFTHDSSYLITASLDGVVVQSKVADVTQKVRIGMKAISTATLSRDGKLVAIATSTPKVAVLDVGTQKELLDWTYDHNVFAIAFSDHGDLLVTQDVNAIRVFQISPSGVGQANAPLRSLSGSSDPMKDTWVTAVALSHDSELLGLGDSNGAIRVVNTRFAGHDAYTQIRSVGHIEALAFSQDNKFLAFACDDLSVHIYAQEAKERINIWKEISGATLKQRDNVKLLRFSQDDTFLAIGTANGRIQIYKLRGGIPLLPGKEINNAGPILALEFSNDSTSLAAVTNDGIIHLLQPDTGEEMHRILNQEKFVQSVVFGEDNKSLWTLSIAGMAKESPFIVIREFPLEPNDLIHQICDQIGHYPSEGEWAKFATGESYHDICSEGSNKGYLQ